MTALIILGFALLLIGILAHYPMLATVGSALAMVCGVKMAWRRYRRPPAS